MTPYERGYAAGLRAAAEECEKEMLSEPLPGETKCDEDIAYDTALVHAKKAILSLPIEGEAEGSGHCVVVPRKELQAIVDSFDMGPEIYPSPEHCLAATIDKLRAMLATHKEEGNG